MDIGMCLSLSGKWFIHNFQHSFWEVLFSEASLWFEVISWSIRKQGWRTLWWSTTCCHAFWWSDWSRSRQEHDSNLRLLLARAAEVILKFNCSKVQLAQSEVVYSGHIVSNEGLRCDPNKVKAISEKPPQQKKELFSVCYGLSIFRVLHSPSVYSGTAPEGVYEGPVSL